LGTLVPSNLFQFVELEIIAFAITVPDGTINPDAGIAALIVIVVAVTAVTVPVIGADVVVTPVSLLTVWYVNWTESLAANPVVSGTVTEPMDATAPVPG
jgi:hypothetical protein